MAAVADHHRINQVATALDRRLGRSTRGGGAQCGECRDETPGDHRPCLAIERACYFILQPRGLAICELVHVRVNVFLARSRLLTQLGHLPSRRVYRQTGLSSIKNWTEPIRCQLPNLMATRGDAISSAFWVARLRGRLRRARSSRHSLSLECSVLPPPHRQFIWPVSAKA